MSRLLARARRDARAGAERGSLSIELIGYVTILVIVAVLCTQAVFATQIASATQQAARNGARAQALGRDVDTEVRRQLPSWAQVEAINTSYPSDGFRVEVVVRVPIGVPGITTSSFVVTRDAVLPRG